MNTPETVATTHTPASRRGTELAAAAGLALVAGFFLGGAYADRNRTVAPGSELGGGPVPHLVGGPGRVPVEDADGPQPVPARVAPKAALVAD